MEGRVGCVTSPPILVVWGCVIVEEMPRPMIHDVEGVSPEVAQYFGIEEGPLSGDRMKLILPIIESKFRRAAGRITDDFPALERIDPRLTSSMVWSLCRQLGPDPDSSRNEGARRLLAKLRQKEKSWRNRLYQRNCQRKKSQVFMCAQLACKTS